MAHDAVIQCATRTILLRTEMGERIEFKAITPAFEVCQSNQMKGAKDEATWEREKTSQSIPIFF